MSPESRYDRHSLIKDWDQDRLAEGRVLVVGAGAVGNEVIKLLALLGIGHILIVDFDSVALSNLSRTVLFRETDIDCPKAIAAAERVREINPSIDVRAIVGDLEFDLGLGCVRSADLVLGCLDSLQARLEINRACRRAGVPWINGGITADAVEVAVFSGLDGPCFECSMSPDMWERRNLRYSCTGLRSTDTEIPAPTTAITASLAAAYMVNEAISIILNSAKRHGSGRREAGSVLSSRCDEGPGDPKQDGLAFGQKIYLTLYPYGLGTFTISQNAECLAHERWSPIQVVDLPSDSTSIRELLEFIGTGEGKVELNFDLLATMRCVSCGESEEIVRPLERCGADLAYCSRCQRDTRAPETVTTIDAHSNLATRPIRSLGLPPFAVVTILSAAGDDERSYYQLDGTYQW